MGSMGYTDKQTNVRNYRIPTMYNTYSESNYILAVQSVKFRQMALI